VQLAADGETCEPAIAIGGCASLTSWCNPTTSRCEARAAIGASCAGAGHCVEAATCDGGTCVARPGVGGACGEGGGAACLGGLECAAGVCVADRAVEVCP
jgi:hypothetical protein